MSIEFTFKSGRKKCIPLPEDYRDESFVNFADELANSNIFAFDKVVINLREVEYFEVVENNE
ncbi:hypothetical protein [Priestia megaterium]|uniref:hypothetical protein n=1 Tax=Priestia megaterium TaxID=1404 RepID=UPI002E207DF4|nr:hypothetical protein [Priestia megaterium]